jgi:hypothetical protein
MAFIIPQEYYGLGGLGASLDRMGDRRRMLEDRNRAQVHEDEDRALREAMAQMEILRAIGARPEDIFGAAQENPTLARMIPAGAQPEISTATVLDRETRAIIAKNARGDELTPEEKARYRHTVFGTTDDPLLRDEAMKLAIRSDKFGLVNQAKQLYGPERAAQLAGALDEALANMPLQTTMEDVQNGIAQRLAGDPELLAFYTNKSITGYAGGVKTATKMESLGMEQAEANIDATRAGAERDRAQSNYYNSGGGDGNKLSLTEYMQRQAIDTLIAAGAAPEEALAVVTNTATPEQRTRVARVRAKLSGDKADIVDIMKDAAELGMGPDMKFDNPEMAQSFRDRINRVPGYKATLGPDNQLVVIADETPGGAGNPNVLAPIKANPPGATREDLIKLSVEREGVTEEQAADAIDKLLARGMSPTKIAEALNAEEPDAAAAAPTPSAKNPPAPNRPTATTAPTATAASRSPSEPRSSEPSPLTDVPRRRENPDGYVDDKPPARERRQPDVASKAPSAVASNRGREGEEPAPAAQSRKRPDPRKENMAAFQEHNAGDTLPRQSTAPKREEKPKDEDPKRRVPTARVQEMIREREADKRRLQQRATRYATNAKAKAAAERRMKELDAQIARLKDTLSKRGGD